MSRFTILLGGDLVPTPRLAAQVAGTRFIAADAGMRHASALGAVPELWVGDFDSATLLLERAYPHVPRQKFPAAKDRTDGELAVAIAREAGARSLMLAGAFGGARADHAFLHLALALRLAEEGLDVILSSGTQEGHPLRHGTAAFDFADDTLFSILGFSDLAGLSVAGARWPLNRVEVPLGSSLTISNIVRGGLEVQLRSGRALLVAQPYPAEGA
jgi:thiamine pyrophosphokinase